MNSPILITGVGKRVGLALSRYFLQKGLSVIGTYRTHYPQIEELQEQGATLYQVDFYDQSKLDQFIATIRENHPSRYEQSFIMHQTGYLTIPISVQRKLFSV